MKELNFIKEFETGRWYIDLPQWEGNKEDLEMVSGADTLLNMLVMNKHLDVVYDLDTRVTLNVSEIYSDDSYQLILTRLADELGNGAYYNVVLDVNRFEIFEIWLCDVTKFVFGYFPKEIYFSVK